MADEDRPDAPELLLDDKTQRGFISWYQSLAKGFYSVHGDNALFVARQFYKTTAVVKYLGSSENGLPGVTLNRNLFENVLREVLVESSDHTVELYEGFGATWRLVRGASPGRLGQFEEELFRSADMGDAPIIMAAMLGAVEGQRTVGIAYVNTTTREMGACEFADDEHFCGLDTVVVQLGARECVLPKEGDSGAQGADMKRLRDVLSRCNAMATERPRSAFSIKNLEQDLARLVKSGNVEQHRDVLERSLASQALAAVVAFGELLGDASSHRKWSLSLYDPGRYMRLDAAAQRALNVLPTRQDANSSFSLYGLMNRARTAMGKRRLKTWLKQPLVQLSEIQTRHDVVDAFKEDAALRERLRDQDLRGLPDVERLARKLEAKRCSLADLCMLYRASAKLPIIEEALRAHDGVHAALLASKYADPLAEAHDEEHLTKFEELLEAAIDLDRIPEDYLISATYHPQLQELKEARDKTEADINELAEGVAKDLGLQMDKTVKLEWHKVANTRTRCLRITNKEEKTVRTKLQKYLVLETRKDGTKFTSKKLKDAAEQLQTVSAQYDDLQKDLVDQVVGVAHTFVEVWGTVAALLAELDVLLGFADLAANAPSAYVRPEMLGPEQGEVVLVSCRHPCVEAQDGVSFIPNDCKMVRGESWFQIITGPNMGGKSTFIRQVGACVLMAQVGCFVPCDSARIAVRDCIFARVGAGDCQQRGVSTFMAEMLETAAILKGATERSLVIIDELGRGTSTYDGFGLAWAISEHIMQVIGCPTLFATHFHELTDVTGAVGVKNLHVGTAVDAASGRLTMLYQIREGACDQSFGIHVAESAHFPATVVAEARRKLAELEGTAPGQQAVGNKRQREEGPSEEEEQAAKRAATFVHDFGNVDFAAMGGEDAAAAARKLLADLDEAAAHNPTLATMMQIACN